jgi:hypothetical protein
MSRFGPFAILPLIFLSGCYTDQQKQVAACQVSLQRDENDPLIADKTKLCMQAHGYQFAEGGCPDRVRTPSKEQFTTMAKSQRVDVNNPDQFDLWVGEHNVVYETMQADEAACYEPLGWGDRQILGVERFLGRTSN